MKKPKLKIRHWLFVSLGLVLIYTAVVTVITAVTGQDLTGYYGIFCGIFGGVEVVSCLILKLKEKEEDKDEQ